MALVITNGEYYAMPNRNGGVNRISDIFLYQMDKKYKDDIRWKYCRGMIMELLQQEQASTENISVGACVTQWENSEKIMENWYNINIS